jgi:hypothetical protein
MGQVIRRKARHRAPVGSDSGVIADWQQRAEPLRIAADGGGDHVRRYNRLR